MLQGRRLQGVKLDAKRATSYFDGYKYQLPLYVRQRGLAYMGSNERLRVVLDRFLRGELLHEPDQSTASGSRRCITLPAAGSTAAAVSVSGCCRAQPLPGQAVQLLGTARDPRHECLGPTEPGRRHAPQLHPQLQPRLACPP